MPLVSVSISLNVQQLKYRHYRDYVNGWFEYYDEKARIRFGGQQTLHHMNDKQYKTKIKLWEKLISDNSVKNYLTANAQLLQIIKYLPISFKNRFPSPTSFDAFIVKRVPSYKKLKYLINRLSLIPSFCLITYSSITYKYVYRLLKNYDNDKYIDIPMGVYTENDVPIYKESSCVSSTSSISERKRKRDETECDDDPNNQQRKKQKLDDINDVNDKEEVQSKDEEQQEISTEDDEEENTESDGEEREKEKEKDLKHNKHCII